MTDPTPPTVPVPAAPEPQPGPPAPPVAPEPEPGPPAAPARPTGHGRQPSRRSAGIPHLAVRPIPPTARSHRSPTRR